MAVITRIFLRTHRRWQRAVVSAALIVVLPACSENMGEDATVPEKSVDQTAQAPAQSTQLTPERMGQWTRNCALCHVRGEGGAPVIGDREAWAMRVEQGEDLLLQHTVEGLNNMPPLGYCMDCETDDFLSLIRFMGGEV